MAPNDVWQLSVQGTVCETQHIHTLHFLEVQGDTLGTSLINHWMTDCLAAYRGAFSNLHAPVQLVKAQKVCGAVPLPGPDELVPVVGQQGGLRDLGGNLPLPAYVASLVTLKGALAGRRYSGRFFLGGLFTSDTSSNTVAAPYKALVQAYVDTLRAAYITPALPDWRMFTFSNLLADGDPLHTKRNRIPGGARISDPVTSHQCQDSGSAVANLIVGGRPTTMRSRKYGHGL